MVKLRLGICEDDSFTRSTLSAALSFRDITVVFSESDPAIALEAVAKTKPHAVLLDLHLGSGPTGLDLARSIRRVVPETGIVFLTSFESPRLIEREYLGVPSGSQYLTKQSVTSIDEVLAAIQRSISKDRKSTLPSQGKLGKLTDHQLRVLERVAQSQSNAEIADALGLSPKSVEGVIRRIVRSLGLAPQSSNQRIQMAKAYLHATGWQRNE